MFAEYKKLHQDFVSQHGVTPTGVQISFKVFTMLMNYSAFREQVQTDTDNVTIGEMRIVIDNHMPKDRAMVFLNSRQYAALME